MNFTRFAAILSITVLLVGVIATAYEFAPNAEAKKATGKYLRDTANGKKHSPTRVCGDELCKSLADSSTAQRKGQKPY